VQPLLVLQSTERMHHCTEKKHAAPIKSIAQMQ
jgi:hypothetical protein